MSHSHVFLFILKCRRQAGEIGVARRHRLC